MLDHKEVRSIYMGIPKICEKGSGKVKGRKKESKKEERKKEEKERKKRILENLYGKKEKEKIKER